ncbi:hypothetical protein Tco_0201141 [Tanacetum coccineum]
MVIRIFISLIYPDVPGELCPPMIIEASDPLGKRSGFRLVVGPEKEKGFFAFVRLVRWVPHGFPFLRPLSPPPEIPPLQAASQPCLFLFSSLGRLGCWVSRMALNVENTGGDFEPDLSFDKPASPEHWFSLACVSLARVPKLDLSFGWSGRGYTSSRNTNAGKPEKLDVNTYSITRKMVRSHHQNSKEAGMSKDISGSELLAPSLCSARRRGNKLQRNQVDPDIHYR